MSAAALLGLLALSQLPLATEAELPGGQKVQLLADQLVFEPTEQRYLARGHTLLKTEQAQLKADELTYDQKLERATAKGNVMLVSGLYAAIADQVVLDMQSMEAAVKGGLLMVKKGVEAKALLEAKTPEELRKLGQNQVLLSGTAIRRRGPGRFEVEGLSFTPCECDPDEVNWRIDAARADVTVGERAVLLWPVVYIKSIPVLPWPFGWLDLPLTPRRSGLLVPRAGGSGTNGFTLDVPVFLTLGDSYDVTLSPGYATGLGAAEGVNLSRHSERLGMKGPRFHTELRYHPLPGTHGRAALWLLYDRWALRDPANPLEVVPGRTRGLRFEATWDHTQDLGKGFFARAEGTLYSDGYYYHDLTTDIYARYVRSNAALYHRGPDTYAGLHAALRQDIRPVPVPGQPRKFYGYSLFGRDWNAAGQPVYGPRTLQELPALLLAVPDRPLLGPVWGGVQLELARVAPLLGPTGDEGTDGIFHPSFPDLDGTQGNARYDAGERQGRDRASLRARIATTLAAGRFARLMPYLAYRQDVYYGERTGAFEHRAYPLAGAELSTELSRLYGPEGARWRHAITPAVELRTVPVVLGAAPAQVYDELDLAIPPNGLTQAFFEVRQRFVRRQGELSAEILRLDVGQGLDLAERRTGDTYARLATAWEGWGLDAQVRYNLGERRLTQASAELKLEKPKYGFYVRYANLLEVGSDRLRRGVDALVGAPAVGPLAVQGAVARQWDLGGRLTLPFGFGVRYETVVVPLAPQKVPHQIFRASYGPACECWRVEAIVTHIPTNGTLDARLNLTIQGFGTFGG